MIVAFGSRLGSIRMSLPFRQAVPARPFACRPVLLIVFAAFNVRLCHCVNCCREALAYVHAHHTLGAHDLRLAQVQKEL